MPAVVGRRAFQTKEGLTDEQNVHREQFASRRFA